MTQTPFSVPTFAPTYADVADAAHRLHGMAHHTPVLRSTTADERLGAQLFFKCENLQRTGAFKFRGAFNTLAQFTDEQRKGGVLAFSAGNQAQGKSQAKRPIRRGGEQAAHQATDAGNAPGEPPQQGGGQANERAAGQRRPGGEVNPVYCHDKRPVQYGSPRLNRPLVG